MKILMRNHKNEKWQMVQSAAYAGEAELQALLAEQPSLLSVNEVREGAGTLVAAVREFPLDIGSVDLVGFTAHGDIAVIECKLAANDEIKRKVIGQVFEYGANLWGLSYEELDQKIYLRSGMNLADIAREAVTEPEWDEENFRSNIEHVLQSGKFILIVVVDEIDEGLSRIVRFVNDAGRPAFSLAALEMRRFQQQQVEILVPHLFGTVNTDKQPSTGSARKQWTEQNFMETAASNLSAEVFTIVKDIYYWSQDQAKYVSFGTGTATGSFTFQHTVNGKKYSLFTIYTTGNLGINYGSINAQVDISTMQKLHKAITAIPGLNDIPIDFRRYPNVRIDDAFIKNPGSLDRFKALMEGFIRDHSQDNSQEK